MTDEAEDAVKAFFDDIERRLDEGEAQRRALMIALRHLMETNPQRLACEKHLDAHLDLMSAGFCSAGQKDNALYLHMKECIAWLLGRRQNMPQSHPESAVLPGGIVPCGNASAG